MNKSKKRTPKRHNSKVESRFKEDSNIPDPQFLDFSSLRIIDLEKRQKKLLRRKIREEYSNITQSYQKPNYEAISTLINHKSYQIDIIKEALEQEKSLDNQWTKTVWRILDSDNPQEDVKQLFLQEESTVNREIEYIKNNLPSPLQIRINTTENGPEYHHLTSIYIIDLVKKELSRNEQKTDLHISIQKEPIFNQPGLYEIPLVFLNEKILEISINVELELDNLPNDCDQAFNNVESLVIPVNYSPLDYSKNYISKIPDDFVFWQPEATKVLKTNYYLGYWKNSWIEDLLDRWRTANLHHAMLPEKNFNSPSMSINSNQTNMIEHSPNQDDDKYKYKILDLPPLIEHDLDYATIDLNVLQHLFRSSYFTHLKTKTLDQFTEEDIRSLSYGITVEISKLKIQGVGTRPLAMIFLSISKLQFARLDVGTADSAIRLCMSGYSTRMGEYLIRQHNRIDSARDYYLEALSLNLVSQRQYDFPLNLYFKSFFQHTYIPSMKIDYVGFIKSIPDSEILNESSLQDLSRGILELGSLHYGIAEKAFCAFPERIKNQVFSLIRNHLNSKISNFLELIEAYKQENQKLSILFQGMQKSSSTQGMVYSSSELAEIIERLGFLLNATNKAIAKAFLDVNEGLNLSIRSKSYEEKIKNIRTAQTGLERVLSFGADNRTTMWADKFSKIANHWMEIIDKEVTQSAQDISPIVNLSLPEENISYNYEKKLRVIFRIQNTGSGTADSVNIGFLSKDGTEISPPIDRNFCLEPQDAIETYSIVESNQNIPLDLDYEITYIDPDRNLVTQPSKVPLHLDSIISNLTFQNLFNPFRSDKEVDDDHMFVGRDLILDEIYSYAVKETLGGLLMLHGQKRVGKSSLLSFIERRMDLTAPTTGTMAVKVSWLDYSAHSATNVFYELLIKIKEKCQILLQKTISIPSIEEIRTSYSFVFNEILRQLNSQGVNRLVLLIDEFDVIVNQIDDEKLGFNRMFFEYLRGLSKRSQVALVLTGGEKMPILFDRMGEVFNHDRTWRIGYLNSGDGSVEKLIENDYIKNKIFFNKEAISKIKETSSCNPYFIQMICQELIERCKSQLSIKVCQLDVQEVAHALVHNTTMTKSLRHLYAPFENPDYLDMAIIGLVSRQEMSGHKPQYVEKNTIIQLISKEYRDRSIDKMSELIRREVLNNDPDDQKKICIMLPLFRDWFINNQPEYDKWVKYTRS